MLVARKTRCCCSWLVYWLTTITLFPSVLNVVLPSFSWDPRNQCFSGSGGGASLSVDQESQLYILCPSVAITEHIQESITDQKNMYENMYLCTKEEYDRCGLDGERGDGRTRLVMKCDNPLDTQKLMYQSFGFQQFQNSEHGYAFEVGKTYYFIATSNGTKVGLDNREGGRCRDNNMKLSITICAQGDDCHLNNKVCTPPPLLSADVVVASSLMQAPPPQVITPTTPTTTTTVTSSPTTSPPQAPNCDVPSPAIVEAMVAPQISKSTQKHVTTRSPTSSTSTTLVFVAVGSFLGGVVLTLLIATVYRKSCVGSSAGPMTSASCCYSTQKTPIVKVNHPGGNPLMA